MTVQALFLVLGLICLSTGAEALVRGGSRLASRFGVSPLFIGLTVVAYGTSSPELVVSTLAALADRSEIAVGNVIGSNIFNIAVVLGIAALIAPLPVRANVLRREVPVVIAITFVVLLLALGGGVTRPEGAVLLLGLIGYTVWAYRNARREGRLDGVDVPSPNPPRSLLGSLGLVAIGVILLSLGADLLLETAVEFARRLGISDTMIGLTLVATGTSLPELATSIVAALRRELDIAMGNVLGSNIFNILGILGLAALLEPVGIAHHMTRFDIPVALIFAVACLPIMLSARRISRMEGTLLFLGYCAYLFGLWLIAGSGWGGVIGGS